MLNVSKTKKFQKQLMLCIRQGKNKKKLDAIVNILLPNMIAINNIIENIIAATKIGHFNIFCKAIDITITTNVIAKNINKIFIIFLLYYLLSQYIL